MDQAIISDINCSVYLSSKLEHTSSPGCGTMHWQTLTSSPSASWCRSLGMLRMSCISTSTTTGAIRHADGSGTTSIACDNLKMNNTRTNSIPVLFLSATAGCDGASQGWRLWRLAKGRLCIQNICKSNSCKEGRKLTSSVFPYVDVWTRSCPSCLSKTRA